MCCLWEGIGRARLVQVLFGVGVRAYILPGGKGRVLELICQASYMSAITKSHKWQSHG